MKSYVEESGFFGKENPEELAEKYGTPLYVYNEDNIRQHMKKVAGVINKYPYRANYSMKANSNLSILKMALEEGLNADAMSIGEMILLLKAGFPADRIFFVPNNVAQEELQFAINHNIMTSLDSLEQLELFGSLNPGGKCSVRINPGIGAGHHEKVITAGKKTKFGIEEHDVDAIFEIAREYDLHIVEINQHVGSQYLDPQPFLEAVENFLRIAEKFDELEYIDFGGGYGIPYHKLEDEAEFDMEDFSKRFTALLDAYVEKHPDNIPLFKSEPGRYCVAEGGVILGRVHAVKQNYGNKYIGTDIGMNVLARPTLYDSWHDLEVLRDGKAVTEGERENVYVTGNICESGDLLCKDRNLPVIKRGDLICVLDAGAYGFSMSSSHNSRPRPAEVLITKEGTAKLIRKRETYEYIFSNLVED
ncbi:MAG: diaminopimelate decarboxylase [Erysipelotrichaceae bacterium]|nr:diaminopimelate decarboxylase [Erysipelotrichaceae bacterium]